MTVNTFYSKKVLDHFKNPRNFGKIDNPDGIATVGNPVCGDIMKIYIKVGKKNNKEYIKEIRFQTLGCGAAIATSSIATELVKGKSLDLARKISNKQIITGLDRLPPAKIHCSLLAARAIKKAIDNYEEKLKKRLTNPKKKQ